jgi:hypothetical protein
MTARTLALLALVTVLLAAGPADAADPVKVVYHLNLGIEQAGRAMNNIKNHLNADPTARIVVVTHGPGIDFLLKDAKTPSGAPFSNAIDELATHGVEFRVCKNTLETRKIDAARVVPDGKIVDSGVAEIARLQAREGYVYLKP